MDRADSSVFIAGGLALTQRQEALALEIPRTALVIGAGGTGTWVALTLAMAGCQDISLVDADVVEASNLNRLPFPIDAIGRPKVEALADEILRLRPLVRVTPYQMRWREPDSIISNNMVGFDCTDHLDVQRAIHARCQKMSVLYVRSGCDAIHFTAAFDLPWGPSTGGGYQGSVPIWAGPPLIAAAYAVGIAVANWGAYSGDIDRGEENEDESQPTT